MYESRRRPLDSHGNREIRRRPEAYFDPRDGLRRLSIQQWEPWKNLLAGTAEECKPFFIGAVRRIGLPKETAIRGGQEIEAKGDANFPVRSARDRAEE
jgi:hypothetical protein